MKTTVYLKDFRQAFQTMGRGDQFSGHALRILFEYLEEVDPDYDLDVIELCCDYAEDTPENIAQSYDIYVPEGDDLEGTVKDFLFHEGVLVGETDSGSLVYRNF